MNKLKQSFEETLGRIVSSESCAGCAACVISCPFSSLEYIDSKPQLIKNCENCGICSKVCPRYNPPWSEIEKFVYGREKRTDEEFGIYKRIVISRSTDREILQFCQDGGVVTTILKYALENEIIDGAAVSGISESEPFYPIPILATTIEEILRCAGTRYTYSPNLLALREGIRRKREKLAFVGTPCQIQAIRRIQMIPLKKYTKSIKLVLGLMCTESFTYEGLMKRHIQEKLGINLKDIKKMNIKAKLLVTMKTGEIITIPLKEVKSYVRKGCISCTDFSSELADISFGGVGLSGWTLTIIRTERGEEIFEEVENGGLLETKPVEEKVLNLLVKLSRRKRGD